MGDAAGDIESSQESAAQLFGIEFPEITKTYELDRFLDKLLPFLFFGNIKGRRNNRYSRRRSVRQ
jgi:hypothetical protein